MDSKIKYGKTAIRETVQLKTVKRFKHTLRKEDIWMISSIHEQKRHTISQDVLSHLVLSDLATPWTVAY